MAVRPQFEDAWRRRFVERGGRFRDEAGVAGWSATGLDARLRRFAALWPGARQGALWVDAGCGAGTYVRHLLLAGATAVGVDYSTPSLRRARGAADQQGYWVAADVKFLPLAPGRAEGILCFGVMQALDSPDPALEELWSVLRPGGELWVDALNGWCLPNLLVRLKRRLLGQPRHLRYDSPAALRRRLRKLGARPKLHWLPLVPGRFRRMQRWLEQPLAQWLFRRVPLVGLVLSHSFILVARRPETDSARGAGR